MRFKDKKMAVLHQLSRESEPISLLDLLRKMEKKYSERSLRRWLTQMVKEKSVEVLGRKRATKYQALQSTSGIRSCFGSESIEILEKIRYPLYERKPVTYIDEWLDGYQPNVTFYLSLNHRSQLYKAGKRSKKEEPAGTYAHQIFDRLLIDLSYNSSRLEGNTYSLLDTQRLIFEGEGVEGKLDEEKTMILNHKEAIRYLVDSAPHLKVDKQTICTLHYLLSDGLVESYYAGKVRDNGVKIVGSTYIPFEDPRRLQLQLERITEKAALIEDPYEQSFFLLVHISYLQAFIDVNKRTARLSANIPLITNNLVPLSFKDIEKEDYTSAVIAIYELQNIRPLVDLYVFSYLRTCAIYDTTIKSIGFDAVRVRYRKERRELIRAIIVDKRVGGRMKIYIDSYIRSIPVKDQEAFLADVMEDLQQIDPVRIVGLGITPVELDDWLKIPRNR
jgi:prophage maintenance system killer protein